MSKINTMKSGAFVKVMACKKLGCGAVMLQKDPQLRKCETYENAVNQDTDVKLLSISFTIDAGLWNKRYPYHVI